MKESSTKVKVAVVGSYNADLTVKCDKSLVPGKSLIGGPMQIFGGGRGANCAVAAARAECAVTFVGARGRGGFGGMAQGQLATTLLRFSCNNSRIRHRKSCFSSIVTSAHPETASQDCGRNERIARFPRNIQTEQNGKQMKRLTLTLCGATLLAFASFAKGGTGETDPAFNQFVQEIKAIYTRHPGQALSETESAEVFTLMSAEIDREAHLDHPGFDNFASDKQESIRMEEFNKVRKALADLQAKGVLPSAIKN
jgi:sugar/nucleoside kinase (ribokinase family)